jgi:hypothetical protein
VSSAFLPDWETTLCLGPVRQTEAGQRHASQAEAEFLQRLPPGHGLGHAFGEFIEFILFHTFPFSWLFVFLGSLCRVLAARYDGESENQNVVHTRAVSVSGQVPLRHRQQAGLKGSPNRRN